MSTGRGRAPPTPAVAARRRRSARHAVGDLAEDAVELHRLRHPVGATRRGGLQHRAQRHAGALEQRRVGLRRRRPAPNQTMGCLGPASAESIFPACFVSLPVAARGGRSMIVSACADVAPHGRHAGAGRCGRLNVGDRMAGGGRCESAVTAFLPPCPAHAAGQRGPQGRAPNPNPILGAGPAGARAWLANAARLPRNSVGSMFQTWLTAEYVGAGRGGPQGRAPGWRTRPGCPGTAWAAWSRPG